MNFLNIRKKGVMFGLDARIALAVLAIVSLSISVTQEKETVENQVAQTKQEMRILQAKFLKHWEKIRFKGYYSGQPGDFKNVVSEGQVAELPVFNKKDRVIRANDGESSYRTPPWDYTRTKDGKVYQYSLYGTTHSYSSIGGKKTLVINNIEKTYFPDMNSNTYLRGITRDINVKLSTLIDEFIKEDGLGIFDIATEKVVPYSPHFNHTSAQDLFVFSPKRNKLNSKINFYGISEHTIDKYSPSDYILHIVMYSSGKNKKVETTLPMTLDQLDKFAGAQGDDIVQIFNTKEVYLRAKVEGLRRLTEIKEKIKLLSEAAYLDRISLCASESTPSASCDLDTDGDFDVDDENALLDYNPYPKSSLDTTSAKYYDSTVAFNYASVTADKATGAEAFLSGTLGLPEYYAYDLFGNVLNYQSNVGLNTKGPYSMEVWY